LSMMINTSHLKLLREWNMVTELLTEEKLNKFLICKEVIWSSLWFKRSIKHSQELETIYIYKSHWLSSNHS
jgi:hypothetical protein